MMNAERIKVLYVDDEEGNLMAFRASFRREFDVRTASSGAEALGLLEQDAAHVVISDQRMPVMSGAEFLATVRERWPRAIRIMLTGFSDIEAVIDAINKGGIHAYITKPWDPVDLKLRIEQAYEVHALRAERERLFQRYRQVFDLSGDPIVIIDDKGRFHEANPAAAKLLGLERADLLQRDISGFLPDASPLLAAMRAPAGSSAMTNADLTLITSTGRTIDCLVTATYQGRAADGSILFQAMIKDISDRKQEEVRLKKLNKDLDRRVAARTKQLMDALDDLGAFSYSVAHDLRSPLKSMRSLSDHLSELAVLRNDPGVSEVAERIHRGTSKLITLVDDLLRFARTDQQEVNRATTDLRAAVDECLASFDLGSRRIEFVLPASGSAMVSADPAMLQVVLGNLLSNAIKFTREVGSPRIEVAHIVEDGDHVISVSDNGVGFDPGKGDQLFGMFKRLHQGEQYEGTGIGLALVHRIVHKHGGSCWAEGAQGKGATVHFRIPSSSDNALRMAG